MIALSLNEVESLAAKVGRGGGLAWGLAEELSRGARRLAEGGLPWVQALAAFTESSSSFAVPGRAMAAQWRARGDAPAGKRALCPLRLATLLMDDPSILAAGPLRVEAVALPLWLAGILAPAKAECGFRLAWPGVAIETRAAGILVGENEGGWLAPKANVTISVLTADLRRAPRLGRAAIDCSTLAVLSAIAERVYVPASEASRVRGAGGGGVDAD